MSAMSLMTIEADNHAMETRVETTLNSIHVTPLPLEFGNSNIVISEETLTRILLASLKATYYDPQAEFVKPEEYRAHPVWKWAQVSRAWRSAVFRSPLLWRDIVFYYDRNSDENDPRFGAAAWNRRLEALIWQLKLSRNLPLNVAIYFARFKVTPDGSKAVSHAEQIECPQVKPYLVKLCEDRAVVGRWQSLTLWRADDLQSLALYERFSFPQIYTNLERLRIHSHIQGLNFEQATGKLRDIEFRFITTPEEFDDLIHSTTRHTGWSNITRLTLHIEKNPGMDHSRLLVVLDGMPSLEDLVLTLPPNEPEDPPHNGPVPTAPVSLVALKKLDLSVGNVTRPIDLLVPGAAYSPTSSYLLGRIHVPNVTSLRVAGQCDLESLQKILLLLQHPSFSGQLTRFCIQPFFDTEDNMTEQMFVHLMRTLPATLEDLKLEFHHQSVKPQTKVIDWFSRLLLGPHGGPGQPGEPLRNLRYLDLGQATFDFNTHMLLTALIRRAYPHSTPDFCPLEYFRCMGHADSNSPAVKTLQDFSTSLKAIEGDRFKVNIDILEDAPDESQAGRSDSEEDDDE